MKTLLNVKTDPKVKDEAKKLSKELGLPLSVVVNAYLKQFIRDKGVYFNVIPRMSRALENLIGRVETDLRKGKNISPVFSSAKEMDDYLDSL